METWKIRVIIEYLEVYQRLCNLEKMLADHESNKLPFELNCPVEMLQNQLNIMRWYEDILYRRILIEFNENEVIALVGLLKGGDIDAIL